MCHKLRSRTAHYAYDNHLKGHIKISARILRSSLLHSCRAKYEQRARERLIKKNLILPHKNNNYVFII